MRGVVHTYSSAASSWHLHSCRLVFGSQEVGDPDRDGNLAHRSHTVHSRPPALSARGRCGACDVGPTECNPQANHPPPPRRIPVVQSSAVTCSAHQAPSWPQSPAWPVLFCGLCSRVQGYPDSLPGEIQGHREMESPVFLSSLPRLYVSASSFLVPVSIPSPPQGPAWMGGYI